jgi:energy-coupling factor transporter ATP-binding protein EcfA2
LVEKLKTSRFLTVLGPSGSGKSSLVRAGLIPALRKGALPGSETWTLRTLLPGAQPLAALAAQVLQIHPQGGMIATLDQMRTDPRTLHLATVLALSDRPSSERVVWVVDQFEEIFTLCRDDAEREAFVATLLYAAGFPEGQSVVVLTLRADFYAKCAAYPELAAAIATHQFLVSPMHEDDLRQAIEAPAHRVGLELEEGLVPTILEDVASQPGALPLLQHALLELWERRRGTMLTLEGYRESGGVQGALARRADAVYDALTPEQQKIAQSILLRLTQPGEGTEDTRRRATLDELIPSAEQREAVERVIGLLSEARLLTTSGGEA